MSEYDLYLLACQAHGAKPLTPRRFQVAWERILRRWSAQESFDRVPTTLRMQQRLLRRWYWLYTIAEAVEFGRELVTAGSSTGSAPAAEPPATDPTLRSDER